MQVCLDWLFSIQLYPWLARFPIQSILLESRLKPSIYTYHRDSPRSSVFLLALFQSNIPYFGYYPP